MAEIAKADDFCSKEIRSYLALVSFKSKKECGWNTISYLIYTFANELKKYNTPKSILSSYKYKDIIML
mgnify:CR=1 FL=1